MALALHDAALRAQIRAASLESFKRHMIFWNATLLGGWFAFYPLLDKPVQVPEPAGTLQVIYSFALLAAIFAWGFYGITRGLAWLREPMRLFERWDLVPGIRAYFGVLLHLSILPVLFLSILASIAAIRPLIAAYEYSGPLGILLGVGTVLACTLITFGGQCAAHYLALMYCSRPHGRAQAAR